MVDETVRNDFERARQKAFFQGILSVMRRKSNELISFHDVRSRIQPEGESYRGMQSVPVSQIVGSVDRFRDFNRAFLPLHNHTAGRWRNVDKAYHQDVRLPPVQLYKVGEVYFVKDGNHRVSVARERGVEYIDAEVIETHIRLPIYASMAPFELLLQVEYAEFLRRTNLDRLRPDHDVRPTTLGRYDEIWDHILVHQEEMIDFRGCPVEIEEAVVDWYDTIYTPIVRVARETGMSARFPDRSEADIYLWATAYRVDLEDRDGEEIDPETSVRELAAAVEHNASLSGRLERFMRRVSRMLGSDAPPPQSGP